MTKTNIYAMVNFPIDWDPTLLNLYDVVSTKLLDYDPMKYNLLEISVRNFTRPEKMLMEGRHEFNEWLSWDEHTWRLVNTHYFRHEWVLRFMMLGIEALVKENKEEDYFKTAKNDG